MSTFLSSLFPLLKPKVGPVEDELDDYKRATPGAGAAVPMATGAATGAPAPAFDRPPMAPVPEPHTAGPDEYTRAVGPPKIDMPPDAAQPYQRASAAPETSSPAPAAATQPQYERAVEPPSQAPRLVPVTPDTQMPTRTKHGGPHDSRLKDALKMAGYALAGGGGIGGALGGFVGGLISPQRAHDVAYQRAFAKAEPYAKAEMAQKEKYNKGIEDQTKVDNTYYDNQLARQRLEDARINRQNNETDRTRTYERQSKQDLENTAADHVKLAVETGRAIDPRIVKGTSYEQYGGQTLRKVPAPITPSYTPVNTDQGLKRMNTRTGELEDTPYTRTPRERAAKDPQPVINEMIAHKEKFEELRNVAVPKAQAKVQQLRQLHDAIKAGNDAQANALLGGLDPDARDKLKGLFDDPKTENRLAAIEGEAQKAQADADALVRQRDTVHQDFKTRFGRYKGWKAGVGSEGSPYIVVDPQAVEESGGAASGRRTGLL